MRRLIQTRKVPRNRGVGPTWTALGCAVALCVTGASCKRLGGNSDGAGPVVAKAGPVSITRDDVDNHLRRMPEQARERLDTAQGRQDVLQAVADRKLLAAAAREQGVDRDPETARKIEDMLILEFVERETNRRFTDEKAQALYDENKDRFTTERVRLRQILARIRPEDGEKGEQKAREKAAKILSQVRGGVDFRAAAVKASDDHISAPKGGDLGEIACARLPPPLDQACGKLKAGEVSEVLQSGAGFHILQMVSAPVRDARSLQEVKPVLRMMFQETVRQELLKDLRGKYPLAMVRKG